ncbi:IS630 family transposase [Bradyrhizobium sp. WSM471]|nr:MULTISPECIES: IS630 family transposase [Bradyrhizobium]UFW44930.1 IS630 family transposase [Bradyrhizobium canariense]
MLEQAEWVERTGSWRIPRLRSAKRGAVSWLDGGERSSWRRPTKRSQHWRLFRGRELKSRDGCRGRRCCWPIARTLRVLRSGPKTRSPSSDGAALCRASAGRWAAGRPYDRPRPGKQPTITPEAKAWLVSLACDEAKDHGYPHELWTTRLLARHAREHGPAAEHACLTNLVQGTVCKILGKEEIKPHKVRYYLENRDAEFQRKMAEVLCVYREVAVLKNAPAKSKRRGKPVAIVSCDEKPGIQAIATTAPDLPPEPGIHAGFARDHEYKRHGTLSLLAGIDLLPGKVHALVRDRHRSREFIELLRLLDVAYPRSTTIKLILDNHSAHISRETRAWPATRPSGRFEFTLTPKQGSWLNLIEGFFSKFARSVI